jgi:hypothetical protein
MQCALTTGAGLTLRLDHHLAARQVFRQRADVAHWLPARRYRLRSPSQGIIVVRRRRGDNLNIRQRKLKLRRIERELLGARPEDHALQCSHLALQVLIARLQVHDDRDQPVGIARQRCRIERHDRLIANQHPIRTSETVSGRGRLGQDRRARHHLRPVESGKQ